MFNRTDLTREIERVIEVTTGRKHPEWITEAVMQNHTAPEGEDGEFFIFTARSYVREAVGKILGRAKLSAALVPDTQLVLPGFSRLQKEYLVDDEDGTTVSVPVEEMSDAQLLAKRDELRAMAEGCQQHADEIERYVEERRAATAA